MDLNTSTQSLTLNSHNFDTLLECHKPELTNFRRDTVSPQITQLTTMNECPTLNAWTALKCFKLMAHGDPIDAWASVWTIIKPIYIAASNQIDLNVNKLIQREVFEDAIWDGELEIELQKCRDSIIADPPLTDSDQIVPDETPMIKDDQTVSNEEPMLMRKDVNQIHSAGDQTSFADHMLSLNRLRKHIREHTIMNL